MSRVSLNKKSPINDPLREVWSRHSHFFQEASASRQAGRRPTRRPLYALSGQIDMDWIVCR